MFPIAHTVTGHTPPRPMGTVALPSHSRSQPPSTRRVYRVINPNARGYRGESKLTDICAATSRISAHSSRLQPQVKVGTQQPNAGSATTEIRFIPQYPQPNQHQPGVPYGQSAEHWAPSNLIWTHPMSAPSSNNDPPMGLTALPDFRVDAIDLCTAATIPADNVNLEQSLEEQPLEMIFVPRPLTDHLTDGPGLLPGPKETLFFNETATGLGTFISDCIDHSNDTNYLFGRGNEPFPLSWERHCSTMSSEDPDVMIIEYTWPGYPYLSYKREIRYRSKNFPEHTIAKRHLARLIGEGFSSMYQAIQDNERKLRAGEPADPIYLLTHVDWELGPNGITLEDIKVVSLKWAYGCTFQPQMAVAF